MSVFSNHVYLCKLLWFCPLMAHLLLQRKADGVKNKFIISALQLLLSLWALFLTLVAKMSESSYVYIHCHSPYLWQVTCFQVNNPSGCHLHIVIERHAYSFSFSPSVFEVLYILYLYVSIKISSSE